MDATQTNRERHFNEIRVFISSTFTDMDRERNYLVKHIFPDIRRKCRKRNVVFTPLDLRWGITEEESKSGRVVEICLDEIARTRPFFIGLVGGRYGWVPSPDDSCFGNEAFLAKYPWARDYVEKGMSITEMEMQYGVLANHDEVHACFFLKSEDSIKPEEREPDEEKERKRLHLKDSIIKAAETGKCRVAHYSDLSSLGRAVHDSLMALLDEVAPENKTGSVYDRYLLDQKLMLDNLRSCYYNISESVYDNPDESAGHSLIKHIASERLTVVTAVPGGGVSAFLANTLPDSTLKYIDADGNEHEAQVIHTIVDDEISSVERLKGLFLALLVDSSDSVDRSDLAEFFNYENLPLEDLYTIFPECERIWVIDGPEKFAADQGNIDELLKMSLPGLKFVVGTSDEELAHILDREYSPGTNGYDNIVIIDTMTPLAIRKIASLYLRANGKGLVERQLSFLTGARILETPRQLVNLLDLMIQFGSYEKLDSFIGRFTTVNDIGGFYMFVLEIIEEDFGADVLKIVFGRLLYSRYGLSEDSLTEGVVANVIEKAALIAALAPYCVRRSGLIMLRDGNMQHVAEVRFSFSEQEIADIRKYLIADAQKRCRMARRSNLLVASLAKLVLRNVIFNHDNAEIQQGRLATSEIVYQQLELNNVKAVYKLLRHFGLIMLSDNALAYIAMKRFHEIGKNIFDLIDSYDILLDFKFYGGDMSYSIYNAALAVSGDADAMRRRIKSLWLPARYKKKLRELLPDNRIAVPLLELWKADEADRLSLNQLTTLAQVWDEVIDAKDKELVKQLGDKVSRSIECVESSTLNDDGMLSFSAFAFYRLRALIAIWKKDSKGLGEAVGKISSMALNQAQEPMKFEARMFALLKAVIEGRSYFGAEIEAADRFLNGVSAELYSSSPAAALAAILGDDRHTAVPELVRKAAEEGVRSVRYASLCKMAKILMKLCKYDYAFPVYKALAGCEKLPAEERMPFVYSAFDCMPFNTKNEVLIDWLQSCRHIAFQCHTSDEPYCLLSKISSAQFKAGMYERSIETARELCTIAEKNGRTDWVANGIAHQSNAMKLIAENCEDAEERKKACRESFVLAKKGFDLYPDDPTLWSVVTDSVIARSECGDLDNGLLAETRQSGERILENLGTQAELTFLQRLLQIYDLADDAVAFAALVEKYQSLAIFLLLKPVRYYSLLYRGTDSDKERQSALYMLGREMINDLQKVKIRFRSMAIEDSCPPCVSDMKPIDDFHNKARDILATVRDFGEPAVDLFKRLLLYKTQTREDGIVDGEESLAKVLVHAATDAYMENKDFPFYVCFFDYKLLTDYYYGHGLGWLNAALSVLYESPFSAAEFKNSYINLLDYFDEYKSKNMLDDLIKGADADFDAKFPQLFEHVYEKYGPSATEFKYVFSRVIAPEYPQEGLLCRFGKFCRFLLDLPDKYADFFTAQSDSLSETLNDMYFISDEEAFTDELWRLGEAFVRKLGICMPGSMLLAALDRLDLELAHDIYSRYCDGKEATWINWNYALRLLREGQYGDALTVASAIRYDEDEYDESADSNSLPDDNRFMRSLVYRAMGEYDKSWEVRFEPIPEAPDEDGIIGEDLRTNNPFYIYDAVGAILVGDYERADREIGLVTSADHRLSILRCVMMLRVNNPVGEAPLYKDFLVGFEESFGSTPDGDLNLWDSYSDFRITIPLCASWRMLELARYKRRHGQDFAEEIKSARKIYANVMSHIDRDTEFENSGADFYFLKKELEEF